MANNTNNCIGYPSFLKLNFILILVQVVVKFSIKEDTPKMVVRLELVVNK